MRDFDVSGFFEHGPLRAKQIFCVGVCLLLAIFDGFDTQAAAFVGRTLSEDFAIGQGQLAWIFASSLVGLALGAAVGGIAGDQWGRRRTLLTAIGFSAALSMLTAASSSLASLLLLRFGTGIGLGAMMPNLLTLGAEFTPVRHRSSAVLIISCGFPFGAALGARLSVLVMPSFGWPGVFLAAGILLSGALGLAAMLVPESWSFLMRLGRSTQVRELLRSVEPGLRAEQIDRLTFTAPDAKRPIRDLLSGPLKSKTLAIWGIFFLSTMVLFLLLNWLPFLESQTTGNAQSTNAAVAFNFGGMFGGLLLGPALDRLGQRNFVTALFSLATLSVLALGLFFTTGSHLLLAFLFVCGFLVLGASFSMHAVAAGVYRDDIRATGLGAALGVGRVGAILGPFVGWACFSNGPSFGAFTLVSLPLLVVVAATIVLNRSVSSKRGTRT